MAKTCYYCGALAQSKEHVPPKQFVRDLECDRITVPSCHTHNTDKGGVDQAVATAMMMNLFERARGDVLECTADLERQLPLVVRRVVRYIPSSYARTFRTVKPTQVHSFICELTPLYHIPFSLDPWIRQIAAALAFDADKIFHQGSNWDETKVWSPSMYSGPHSPYHHVEEVWESMSKKRAQHHLFDHHQWKQGWTSHPRPYPSEIFSFQVSSLEKQVLLKLSFLSNYTFYALLPEHEGVQQSFAKRLQNH